MTERVAWVFGATGIGGRALVERLKADGGWKVVAISRRGAPDLHSAEQVPCDLNDAAGTARALVQSEPPTHAFYATWSRQPNESENCRVNGAMLLHALEAAAKGGRLKHAALVTGLKHYLGSFEDYATAKLDTPFSEEQPRLKGQNFYYTQEDVLFEAAERHGFTWSVARPHTIIGFAPGNAMNLGTSLAVFATLCKETGRPFQFPGSPEQHGGLVDMTAADLLAEHLLWEASTPGAANKAFNVVNGDVFRWRTMWPRIADFFGVPVAPYPGRAEPLEASLGGAENDWDAIVRRRKLEANPLARVAVWWHVDADLGRTQECLTDMSRSRELGFHGYRRTWSAMKGLFERLRKERIIP
jgi:nucleoside-diphosphate-sugar epimerase